MSDWDAAQYHRLSDPQRSWGLRVLDRLAPAPSERILDIGCGTGRLTSEIQSRAPSAHVTGIDRSRTMLIGAKRASPSTIRYAQADATRLPFGTAFDAVFSTATFHWVPDHPLLFSEIHSILLRGGRLVSQAGGGANLTRLYTRTAALAREPGFAPWFEGWQDPWRFAGLDDTRARLEHVGFTDIHVWLEPAPTTLPGAQAFAEFVTTVCLRLQLDRLPEERRSAFVRGITDQAAEDEPPFTLDYWRLNIDGRKP